MEGKFQELLVRCRDIYHIQSVLNLLNWDQSTYMPPAAAEARGKQRATLSMLAHQRLTDPKMGELLEELTPYEESLPTDSDEASIIRVTKREYERATKIPAEFLAKQAHHSSLSMEAWKQAKAQDDFKLVEPYLEKTVELSREYATFFPEHEHPADPHIQITEYGMKASMIKELFAQLKRELVPFVEEIMEAKPTDPSCIRQHFPSHQQLDFSLYLLKKIGFDFERGRQDQSPHPFMTKLAHGDIRITTRVNEQNLKALFSTMHEAGHAFYEMGVHSKYEGTFLHRGASSGVHESQSRLWENIIGRSLGFWKHVYPELQKQFPSQLGNVGLQEFYQAINHVEPAPIRVEADELTYNLHVLIRFELELGLLEGNIDVKDLPEAWRSLYQSYLGVTPESDRLGVLQDIHWYKYLIGATFPGYTIGNILSCQLFEAACTTHPEILTKIEEGNFTLLHQWLQQHIYIHGRKYTPDELVQKATGSKIRIEPYMKYLRKKYQELYLS